MNEELKACPFCGSANCKPWGMENTGEREVYVQCADCASDGPYGETNEEAIAKWNTRTALSDERKTALEEALRGLSMWDLSDGPCWCDNAGPPHDRWCRLARRALLDHPKEPKT